MSRRNLIHIDEIISQIRDYHSHKHTDQIYYIINCINELYPEISKKNITLIQNFLYDIQSLLWCIDDTIDEKKDLDQKLSIFLEISKFYLFLKISSDLLNIQKSRRLDLIKFIINKETTIERIIRLLLNDLEILSSIPLKEKQIMSINPKNLDIDEIKRIVLELLYTRTKNVEVYIHLTNEILGIKLPKNSILSFRALQLLREDLEDISKDVKNESANTVLIIKNYIEKKDNNKKFEQILWDIVNSLEKNFLDNGVEIQFLKRQFEKEKIKIKSLLSNHEY